MTPHGSGFTIQNSSFLMLMAGVIKKKKKSVGARLGEYGDWLMATTVCNECIW